MAYEPKEWQCGDTITADDLNHIEQGVADASGASPLIVDRVTNEGVSELNITGEEAFEAFSNGTRILAHQSDNSGVVFDGYRELVEVGRNIIDSQTTIYYATCIEAGYIVQYIANAENPKLHKS
jgi:hypothetical protein